jgi:hypothetical protein
VGGFGNGGLCSRLGLVIQSSRASTVAAIIESPLASASILNFCPSHLGTSKDVRSPRRAIGFFIIQMDFGLTKL